MEQRLLGNSDIAVSPLGLGCLAIGGPFTMDGHQDGLGQVDDAESIRAIRRAVELGVTLFDTADAYGTGHSEEVLGHALRDLRQSVVLATKGGFTYDRATRALTGMDWSPAYIRRALEASLSRLGTDYIDLFQLHTGSIPEDAIAPVFDELERLIPPRRMSLEQSLEYCAGDECLEVTPAGVRIRKVVLDANDRAKIRNRAKKDV